MKIKKTIKRFLRYIQPVKETYANIQVVGQNELLANRVALITGGTSGIGKAIAKTFVESGASIIITGRSIKKINKALEEIRQETGRGEYVIGGIEMDNTQIKEMGVKFEEICHLLAHDQKIDILVNNAGVLGANFPNAQEEEFDKVIDTNLKGVFFLSQLFSKYLIRNQIRGNILNIASSSSLRPAISAYTLSKWGIRGLTLGLARSLAPYGITVNGLAPGLTATPMLKNTEIKDISNTSVPLGRWILPEEIANGALFLVSEMGRSVMGDILYMTGGAALLTYEDMNYNLKID